MGYLPGTLWLLAGVVLAGAVQDFMGAVYLLAPMAYLGAIVKEE